MKGVVNQLSGSLSVPRAALLLASFNVVGLVLGLVRTNLINANFNHFSTGAYFAAFKIPDFIFLTLSAGALSVAFIPVLSDRLNRGRDTEASELTSSVLNFILLLTLVVSLVLIIFPRPVLEHLVVPGFGPQQLDVAANIMRLVAINPFVFAVSSLMASFQQVFGRFLFMAMAPLFYNLAIIASIYIFQDSMGVVGLGLGVALGAVANLLFMSLGFYKLGFRWFPRIQFRDVGFRNVIKVLPVRSLDQGLTYINGIVQTRFASGISVHAVTNFENALMIYNAPVTLIGWAIGTAVFPHFTKRLSQDRVDLFRSDFLLVLRTLIWLSLPIVITAYFARHYLARIISPRDTSEIALIFGFFAVGILFRMIYLIISRFYYAQKDVKTTLKATALALVVNVGLAWYLSRPERLGAAGLALAASLVVLIEVIFLVVILTYRDRALFNRDFVRGLGPILAAAGLLFGFFAFAVVIFDPTNPEFGLRLFLELGLISSLAAIGYVGLSYWWSVKEAQQLVAWVIGRIRRSSPVDDRDDDPDVMIDGDDRDDS